MFLYEEILREFHEEKVRYVIVGGMAFNLLGGMRHTMEMDILVDMRKENFRKIIRILKKRGYSVKQPVSPEDFADFRIRKGRIKNRHMKAFNFYKGKRSFEEVDIIIDSPVNFREASSDMRIIRVGDLYLPVVSIDKLIKMKKTSGRDLDKIDVITLKKLKKVQNEK